MDKCDQMISSAYYSGKINMQNIQIYKHKSRQKSRHYNKNKGNKTGKGKHYKFETILFLGNLERVSMQI